MVPSSLSPILLVVSLCLVLSVVSQFGWLAWWSVRHRRQIDLELRQHELDHQAVERRHAEHVKANEAADARRMELYTAMMPALVTLVRASGLLPSEPGEPAFVASPDASCSDPPEPLVTDPRRAA